MFDKLIHEKEEKTERFFVLDSWRGVAALLVCCMHFHANYFCFNSPFIRHGVYWVDFFFVLSGFVLSHSYEKRIINGLNFKRFILLRLCRIYPVHLVILMSMIVFEIVFSSFVQDFSAQGRGAFEGGNSILSIITNLLLVHGVGFESTFTWNGPSWSISSEFYTYALFYFTVAFSIFLQKKTGSKFSKFIVYSLVFLSAFYLLFFVFRVSSLETPIQYSFLRCILGFFLGGIAYFFRSHIIKCKIEKKFATFFEVAIVSTLFLVIYFISPRDVLSFILLPIIFIFIVIFSYGSGLISRFLETRLMLFLGSISYCVYMVHSFIQARIINFTSLAGKIADVDFFVYTSGPDSIRLIGPTVFLGNVATVAMLVCVVLIASFLHFFVEKPIYKRFSAKYR